MRRTDLHILVYQACLQHACILYDEALNLREWNTHPGSDTFGLDLPRGFMQYTE